MSFTASSRTVPVRHPDDTTALGRLGGVSVVLWPAEADRREQLAESGEPCVLVVADGEPAPHTSLVEDWVREPVEAAELAARCRAAAAQRAVCGEAPTLDDGLLLHRGTWAAIPPAQVAMVELLVARMGSVVRKEELAAAAVASGGSDHGDAVKAAMGRLGKRLAPLGLTLRAIRGRGYLLEAADACPMHGTRSAANT